MTESALRIGVVGIPGAWSSEILADAAAARTGERLLIDMERVVFDSANGRVLFGEVDLCGLDAIWIKKIGREYSPHMLDRLELLRYVASSGVRCVSRPEHVLRLLDRLSCTVTLVAAGTPMPATVVTEDKHQACEAIRRFGSAVLKPLYSTKARGMRLVTPDSDLVEEVDAFRAAGNPMMYIQQKVDLPDQDLGIVFLGGEYLGTYARVNRSGSSWNTTIHHGGKYEKYEPCRETIEVARRAQEPFGLDFTCVDVVELADGPIVFEVSAFGGFRGMVESHGTELGPLLIDYLLNQIPRP